TMQKGTVKWFNPTKGYGFIRPQTGDKDVFVHISAVERAGLSSLNEGQTVEYELVTNRGKTSAENLKIASLAIQAGFRPTRSPVAPGSPGVFFLPMSARSLAWLLRRPRSAPSSSGRRRDAGELREIGVVARRHPRDVWLEIVAAFGCG